MSLKGLLKYYKILKKAAISRAADGTLPDVEHRIYEGVVYFKYLFLFSL
jgi:hypothetical protein